MKKIKYRKIPTVLLIVLMTLSLISCSGKDSGLYRVSVEDGGFDVSAKAGDEAESDQPDTAHDADMQSEVSAGQPDNEYVSYATDNETPVYGEGTGNTAVYVHICGQVRKPGVYELALGDRIYQAVEAAGGFCEDAVEDYVNLAMPVSDGMKITIPTAGDIQTSGDLGFAAIEYASASAPVYTSGGLQDRTAADPSGISLTDDTGRININTADEALLMTLSGIGHGKARAIIAYREEHGGFGSIDELKNVSGIGEATYNKFKEEITVGINQ